MADDSTTIELSQSEHREVAGHAVVCARPALAIFEPELPDDRRPRAAIDAAQAFADGAERTKALRDSAWAAHRAAQEARDAGQAAESDAARGRPRGGCGVPPCETCPTEKLVATLDRIRTRGSQRTILKAPDLPEIITACSRLTRAEIPS
jgi:hypothetical protein